MVKITAPGKVTKGEGASGAAAQQTLNGLPAERWGQHRVRESPDPVRRAGSFRNGPLSSGGVRIPSPGCGGDAAIRPECNFIACVFPKCH